MTERPALRYHGGKWRLAPWVIQHFPPHRIYVEPYGGAAGVLLRKARVPFEVYNDLDSEVVNVFRVLRDAEAAARLREQLYLTPWSREEFNGAYQPTEDPVERARRTIVRQFMGFGTTGRRRGRTGFRARSYRDSGSSGVADWCNYLDALPAFVERLRGVVIENRPALEVIRQQDQPETLFYVDPPYVLSTRTSIGHKGTEEAYQHDLTDEEHRELAALLKTVEGYVVVSGYHCALYEELYPASEGWWTAGRNSLADGAQLRRETLYLSARTATALQHSLLGLDLGASTT